MGRFFLAVASLYFGFIIFGKEGFQLSMKYLKINVKLPNTFQNLQDFFKDGASKKKKKKKAYKLGSPAIL